MKPATKPVYQNVFRVSYVLGRTKGYGADHLTIGAAYGEVAELRQAGFAAIVEMAQVRVISTPIA